MEGMKKSAVNSQRSLGKRRDEHPTSKWKRRRFTAKPQRSPRNAEEEKRGNEIFNFRF
jgi:hypothetical protein